MEKRSNLKKFEDIETMMDKAKELMPTYENSLKERYDYMNELRREYSNLKHTLGKTVQSLNKRSNELEEDEDIKNVVKAALSKLETQIEALQEENQYGEHNDAVKQLERAREQLEGKIDESNLMSAWRIVKARGINIEEIDVLMDLMDAMKGKGKGEDVKKSIISRINSVQSEYASSFVTFRKAYDEGEDVPQMIGNIIGELEDAGYSQEAQMLEDAKPSTTEERGLRPDPEPLLNILKPIRSEGLKYFQSGNNKSESYDLNITFANEVRNTRRALLEDREYVGTNSAFTRLEAAFDELSDYMYDKFYQLGGKPHNYHGHEKRKNK